MTKITKSYTKISIFFIFRKYMQKTVAILVNYNSFIPTHFTTDPTKVQMPEETLP